jgi:UDP-N-acetylmuramate-alanine ligase
LCDIAQPGDVVIVMGAGNIDSVFVGLPLEN